MRSYLRALVTESDPEPVIFLASLALLLFGGTLILPARTFDLPTFHVLASLFQENVFGVLLVLLGLGGIVSLLLTSEVARFACMALFTVHVFIATVFVLSVPYTTGNIYFIFALGVAWAFVRLGGKLM